MTSRITQDLLQVLTDGGSVSLIADDSYGNVVNVPLIPDDDDGGDDE